MQDHKINPDEEYHFESSDEFCSPEVVNKAKKIIENNIELTKPEQAQLNAIASLELARYEHATKNTSIESHGKEIQEIRNILINNYKLEPFDNGEIDKAFYDALNREYGYER